MHIGSVNTLYGARRISLWPTALAPQVTSTLHERATRFDPSPYRELLHAATKLRSTLRGLRRSFRALQQRGVGRPGGVTTVASAQPLGLDPTETSTTLQSTEQVNAISTSYTPFGPAFAGSSTSLPTLTGTYTGSADDVHTFKVKKGGTVGGKKELQIEVKDQYGHKVEVIKIPPRTPPDTPLSLNSGLTLSLSAGKIEKKDTFQVSLFATVGSAVDPDKPFDGTRNDRPNFEPGLGVTSGSFDVNGVTIPVLASDTINAVLAKINSSAADVTAVFDAATETVQLTSAIVGSSGQIILDNDTSGFLAATKLDGAVAQPGRDSDLKVAIDTVGALGQISGGQFSINGISVSVDPSADSLEDVMGRIRQSVPPISASYDAGSDVFRIQAPAYSTLELDDGSSGFFTALGIAPKSYAVRPTSGRLSSASRKTLVERLEDLTESLNKLSLVAANPKNQAVGSATMQRLWSSIQTAVESRADKPLDQTEEKVEVFGLRFQQHGDTEFATLDPDAVSEAIQNDQRSFFDFFLKQRRGSTATGLFDAMNAALRDQQKSLLFTLAKSGVQLVDIVI